MFKVHRYEPNYPGLLGRDLTPGGVIELPVAQKGKTGLDQANEQRRDDRQPTNDRRRQDNPDRQRPSG